MIDTTKIDSLIGADVIDHSDRKIGTVGQVYVDSESDTPTWVTVNTGLFGLSESFAPLENADFTGGALRIAFEKSFVKDAPRIENDGALESADEDALFRYYGTGQAVGGAAEHDRVDEPAVTSAGTAGTAGTADSADSMTRSEEQLHVGTEQVSAGRARLRKHIVTENQTVTVPVSHEEVRLEREPITDGNVGDARVGQTLSEDVHEVELTEERVVVKKETVPVERVSLGTETVTENQQVSEEVRKEEIDYDAAATDQQGRTDK